MITLNRKVRFSHPDITYSGTNYTEYLFGSVGLRVNADIRVEVAWSTEDVNMKFLASNDSIQRLDGGLSSFVLDGFRNGDTIVVEGTASNNGTYTISEVEDEFIFVTGALTDETVVCDIFGETPITALDFYPNCIENNTAFSLLHLTDRETVPHYYTDTITTDAANPTPMIVGTNSKGWITPHDAATVYRLSFTNHIQTFVISHSFEITPVYIANQLKNLQDGNPPAAGSYKDRFCLKYVFTIEGKYSSFDPDPAHTTDGNVDFPKGQTGWFNEFINGRPSVWTKSSLLYFDDSDGSGLTAIDYCKTVNVEAILQSQTSGEVGFKVQVMYLPTDESRYVNTTRPWKENFIYERAVVGSGSGVVQGENTGDYHFMRDVTYTSLSGNRAKITFEIDFSEALVDFFDTQDEDNLNYLIFITAQHTTNSVSILTIDQTAVIMDVNAYQCNKDDATLFQVIDEWQFLEYPDCGSQGYSNFNLLPMDTVLTKGQFHVKQGTADEPILLEHITVEIAAVRQNDVEEFPLESFTINTAGFLPDCDNVQPIEFSQERDFILPSGDCRNEIRLFRMPTLDIAGYSAYEFIYPFKVRWEEWRTLAGASRCFPIPTQNWMVYANAPGWTPKFSIKAQVSKTVTGVLGNQANNRTNFEHIVWGVIKDPCDIPYSVEFNTYNSTGVNNLEEIVATDADTMVVATVTGDFSGFTVDQLYGILTLDAWGVGGVAYSREIGTRIDVDEDGVWYGNDNPLRATLTRNSNSQVTLTAIINYLYLPKDTDQLILSARIGYYEAAASSSGATCLNEIMVTDFTCGELEIESVTDANTLVVSGEVETQEMRGVLLEHAILTFITATTWRISGGTIDGNPIASGTTGGNIIKAPAHPYSEANVGDTIQGAITGNVRSSLIEINGIGDMQIGCTFFVS